MPVQVVNESNQPSNTVNLTVIPRVANGRVKWRFQAASDYILQRPAVGPGGQLSPTTRAGMFMRCDLTVG